MRNKPQLPIYQTENGQIEYYVYPITSNKVWNLFASYRIDECCIEYEGRKMNQIIHEIKIFREISFTVLNNIILSTKLNWHTI